jgi:glycosyltransferase involved in cell wall biosynthesis
MTDRSRDKDILVSVVIPSFNAESTIAATLTSVAGQQCDFPFEVIVVDSSADSTPQIISKRFPQVKCIHRQEKTPAAAARNLGARSASGKYIAFLDSDCVVDEEWLQMMMENYNEDYCGIGGPICNSNPETAISWAGFLLEFSDFFPSTKPIEVEHIPSGNLLLTLRSFLDSGGFPEEFHFAQEDRLFSWLLSRKTGKTFLFHPEIKVFHSQREGLRKFLLHQHQIGRGGAELLKITDLPGSNLVRKHPLLTLFILPFVALRKLGRCLGRAIRLQQQLFFAKPQIIPLMVLGQLFWMCGFGKGLNIHVGKLNRN